MLKRTLMIAAAACAFAAAPAYAQVSISATPGSDPYAGPAPTYDFESPSPDVSGGGVVTGSSSGLYAQPLGSTGNYWSIGPSTNPDGILSLSNWAGIASISFIWGSVDDYNFLDVFDRSNILITTFSGADVVLPPDGNQVDPATNPLTTLTFSGTTQGQIGSLRLRSSQANAFEVDNFAVTAVPEPGAWAMLLVGFGFLGSFMRRRKSVRRIRLNYA